jgi:phosphoribosyl 1,2-cyclic phosphodiesterase
VKRLQLVLLTHIHGDHFNRTTIRRLSEERPTLRFGCCEWLAGPLIEAGVPAKRIDVYGVPKIYSYYYGDTVIETFPLSHDVENCGYKLHINGESAIYATDTFTLDGIEAKDFDLYLIEANYTEDEMPERINRKLEAGEYVYEYRAAAGHLSQEKADAWLSANATPGKSKVFYLHRHEERN